MKEKFEIKPLEPKPEEKEPEPRPEEIETWEGEGGTVALPSEALGEGWETQEEAPAEVPETVVEEEKVKTAWQELIVQAKEEFPERIKQIIDKASRGELLHSDEISIFDTFSYQWFRETFGILKKKKQPVQKPKKKQLTEEKLAEKQRKKAERQKRTEEDKSVKLPELERQKRDKMEQLHRALGNLDNGEPVDEFRDETRRIVYFDEEKRGYFVEEGGSRKMVRIGDIVSDYAWGIKYVPDGEMTEPAYRTVAKRILTNETRRDLEIIHDLELITHRPYRRGTSTFSRIWPRLRENFRKEDKRIEEQLAVETQLENNIGWIVEVAVREFISRVNLNMGLDLVVSRATAQEDADYKYDFKIRVKRRRRGIDVQNKNINLIGFQLKSMVSRKEVDSSLRQMKKGVISVDEILTLKVPGKEFREAVKKWFESGEPSGGPEQFLSPGLKKTILKAVTKKLVDIPQDVFDQIVEVPTTAKP